MERNWRDYQVQIPEGESGLWAVRHFEVPVHLEETYRKLRRRMNTEWSMLDDLSEDPEDERHIVAGSYTKLELLNEHMMMDCVMSDTQPEIEEHYPLFDRAHGRVLVHGLGLGMCALACANQPNVSRVHVLERSQHVIKLVGSHITHPKVTIERADALKWRPASSWDVVWSDIWTYISERNLPEMKRLERTYRGKCGWHGFWLRDECERRHRKLQALHKVSALSERFRVKPQSMKPLYRLVYALEKERRP